MRLLGFWDQNRLEELIQFVLHEVGEVADARVVVLNHVQVKLKLLGDGGGCVLGVCVLGPSLTGRGAQKDKRFRTRHTRFFFLKQRTVIINMFIATALGDDFILSLEPIRNAVLKCKERVKLVL